MTRAARTWLVIGLAAVATSTACNDEQPIVDETLQVPLVQVIERDGTCNAVSIDYISTDTKNMIASGELVPRGAVAETILIDSGGREIRRASQTYINETTGEGVEVTCDGKCDDNCPPPTGCYPLGGDCTSCGDCTGWWCGPCICTKGQIRVVGQAGHTVTPGN